MKIYKFKDLRDEAVHNHLFQIIDENKVWCAAPESLNDPEEFVFNLDYQPTSRTAVLLRKVFERFGSNSIHPIMAVSYAILNGELEKVAKPHIESVVRKCRRSIGVTSFSSEGNSKWLWDNYGGSGNGVCVEFDLPDEYLGSSFHPVEYVSKRVFHVDVFLESTIGDSRSAFQNILCTKTTQWNEEKEVRFLGKTPNVNITFEAQVTGLTMGSSVSKCVAERIEKSCERRGIRVDCQ